MKKNLFFIALFALCCVFLLPGGTSYASDILFSDTFDTYSTGTLAGQGGWAGSDQQVVDTGCLAFNCVHSTISSQTYKTTTHITDGDMLFNFKIHSWGTNDLALLSFGSDGALAYWPVFLNHTTHEIKNVYGDVYASPPLDTWFSLEVIWDTTNLCISYNGGTCAGSRPYDLGYISTMDIGGNAGTGTDAEYWADSFGSPNPTTATIVITAPTTGDTITNVISTYLTGNWYAIDPDIYHNITLYFSSHFIGEQSIAKIIPITTSTGSFSIPLSDFGLSANGQWDLKGSATYANTQLSDMYITPDIISPVGFNLIFNVSGFHTPYTFTDFDTWYGTNVANYDTPSAWATGMIGYLQPILEKIAEFGARIQDYLDTSTAWQRGNDIGSVFPVINAYILKINLFFGGFPIAQFFQWGILIMIGMFAIKIILKLLSFIPVIGGGG